MQRDEILQQVRGVREALLADVAVGQKKLRVTGQAPEPRMEGHALRRPHPRDQDDKQAEKDRHSAGDQCGSQSTRSRAGNDICQRANNARGARSSDRAACHPEGVFVATAAEQNPDRAHNHDGSCNGPKYGVCSKRRTDRRPAAQCLETSGNICATAEKQDRAQDCSSDRPENGPHAFVPNICQRDAGIQ